MWMVNLSKIRSDEALSQDEIQQRLAASVAALGVKGKRVLIIIPDGTRTMPMPLMFEILQAEIGRQAAACDYLVALGTHPAMSESQLTQLLGHPVTSGKCGSARIFNHCWSVPATFAEIGTIPADEVEHVSKGLLTDPIGIKINRLLFEYNLVLICGPVFPHEVAGFSGGNKYLFPGVSTGEMIHQTHWLGALLGSYNIIGTPDTPIRKLIELAAQRVSVPVACFALVLKGKEILGLYFGAAREAWKMAAEHSAQAHIQWVERPFRRVLSILPDLYDDMWTGAKGMYKAEPAVADGGEVILYAPHIKEFSYTHGTFLEKIGYHCRDYFLKQLTRFEGIPRGVIAHSIHLRGEGTYDAKSGTERPRITVTLATGISEERCCLMNLNYVDPASINPEDWRDREEEGIKLIPRAGEILYRVKTAI
jgi:nickel-dependent lactate racemase